MNIFIRSVVTGFGFSLGSALYKKLSRRLGLDDEKRTDPPPGTSDGDASDEEGEGGERCHTPS